jgi:hypothetical protein
MPSAEPRGRSGTSVADFAQKNITTDMQAVGVNYSVCG